MAIVKKQIKNKVYSILKGIGENDKCPPQALLIVKTIQDAGGKIGREELLKLLGRAPEEGGLTTNQATERILGFYRPKLVALGVLQEDVVVTEIDVEVPDKPAKPAKAAKADAPVATDGAAAPDAPPTDKVKDHKGKHKAA